MTEVAAGGADKAFTDLSELAIALGNVGLSPLYTGA